MHYHFLAAAVIYVTNANPLPDASLAPDQAKSTFITIPEHSYLDPFSADMPSEDPLNTYTDHLPLPTVETANSDLSQKDTEILDSASNLALLSSIPSSPDKAQQPTHDPCSSPGPLFNEKPRALPAMCFHNFDILDIESQTYKSCRDGKEMTLCCGGEADLDTVARSCKHHCKLFYFVPCFPFERELDSG